jgi:23S rRNA U2552 (ribose-2'-O)-methylase RlmE/FtsJ
MNGNHLKKIRNPRTVLDLGCGKGAWTADIAQEFATADEVVGVDIKLVELPQYPPNCRFEVCEPRHPVDCRLPIFAKGSDTLRITFLSSTRGR